QKRLVFGHKLTGLLIDDLEHPDDIAFECTEGYTENVSCNMAGNGFRGGTEHARSCRIFDDHALPSAEYCSGHAEPGIKSDGSADAELRPELVFCLIQKKNRGLLRVDQLRRLIADDLEQGIEVFFGINPPRDVE